MPDELKKTWGKAVILGRNVYPSVLKRFTVVALQNQAVAKGCRAPSVAGPRNFRFFRAALFTQRTCGRKLFVLQIDQKNGGETAAEFFFFGRI